MIELTHETAIEVDGIDLTAILTEVFCGVYTPFKNAFVESVMPLDDGRTFKLILGIKETEATNGN